MMTVEVDLSELIVFTKDTTYSRDFDLIAERMNLTTVGGAIQPQLQKRSESTAESDRADQSFHILRRFNRYFDCFGAPCVVPEDGLAPAAPQEPLDIQPSSPVSTKFSTAG